VPKISSEPFNGRAAVRGLKNTTEREQSAEREMAEREGSGEWGCKEIAQSAEWIISNR